MHSSLDVMEDAAVPQYQKLKQHIADRIALGELKPGQRVASEAELVRAFSVSRMTVSRALNELANEGVIIRAQGIGTFVARTKSEAALVEIRSIADEISIEGMVHSCQPLVAKKASKPKINALLGLDADDTYYRTILLHLANGVPVQVEDRYVNPKFAPHYLKQNFAHTTPHEHLRSLGPLQAAEHVFEAKAPSRKAARWLKVDTDTSCMVLRRRTWSLNIVASFAIMTAPGSRRRFAGAFGKPPAHAEDLPRL